MAIYRCAACGSANVVTDEVNAGVKYDLVKGVIGAELLGVPGAIAGIGNQTKTAYICKDCGVQLSYPMAAELTQLIDIGLMSKESRKNLRLSGVSIDWNTLKRSYKNIEDSLWDKEEKSEKAREQQSLMSGEATKAEFDEALATFKKYQDLVSDKNSPPSENCIGLKDYLTIQSAIDTIAENYPRFVPKTGSFANYNGFCVDMFASSFLISYATSHNLSEEGRLLNTWTTNDNGELAFYLKRHSYIYDCVLNYKDGAGRKFNDYGSVDWISLSAWWTCSKYVPLYKSFSVVFNKDSLLYDPAVAPDSFGKDTKNVKIPIYIPDYLVINGLLHTAKWTYPDEWWKKVKASNDGNYGYQTILSNYFTAYPEKIDEYNHIVEDFFKKGESLKVEKDESWKKITSIKAQNEANEKKRERYQSEVNSYYNEISRLQGKIFGKAKAQQQIQELKAKISELSELMSVCKNEIAQGQSDLKAAENRHHQLYQLQYDDIPGLTMLLYHLLPKFDYFGVWKPVDETQCCSLSPEVPEAKVAEEQKAIPSQNTPAISQADEILKFKNLLDAGIITAAEFEKKKQQLLGL